MATLTIEIPDLVRRRLEALGAASGKRVEELAREAVESFAGSHVSRRTLLKTWRGKAQIPGTGYSLADLGWLDGYSGQTVDEILTYEGTEGLYNLLALLELGIQEKVKTLGHLKMTGLERMLLAVMALFREVNNGGYDQFFRNSSCRFALAIVDDLLRIGCPEIADITQQALDSLELPRLSLEAIQIAMSAENLKRDRALNRCDIAFYERSELVIDRLFEYVKLHHAGISI